MDGTISVAGNIPNPIAVDVRSQMKLREDLRRVHCTNDLPVPVRGRQVWSSGVRDQGGGECGSGVVVEGVAEFEPEVVSVAPLAAREGNIPEGEIRSPADTLERSLERVTREVSA